VWKRLEEIAEINVRFEKNSIDDETEVTFLPMRCVEELTGRMDTSIEKKYGEIKTGYTPIQDGDLLFAKITPCMENGKIAIAQNLKNGIGFASTEFHTLKFSPDYETKFYFFFLMQEKIRQEAARNMTGTAGQHRVPSVFLKKLKVPVPPLHVQRQIVAVLEQAEAVKRQRQEADALTGALLQSVFREMFGDPVRNEKGWKKAKISDITIFHKQGLYTDVNYADDGIRLIRITDITEDGHLNYSSMPFLSINDKLAEQFKVEQGDFLFARSGVSIGRCAIVESNIPCVFGSFIIKFQFNPKKIDNKFFLHLIRMPSNQYQLTKFTHGSANPNVNADNIKNLEIFIPPLALQQQFAHIVESVGRIREQQVASGRQIEGLCKGLMQRAFAGELVG